MPDDVGPLAIGAVQHLSDHRVPPSCGMSSPDREGSRSTDLKHLPLAIHDPPVPVVLLHHTRRPLTELGLQVRGPQVWGLNHVRIRREYLGNGHHTPSHSCHPGLPLAPWASWLHPCHGGGHALSVWTRYDTCHRGFVKSRV